MNAAPPNARSVAIDALALWASSPRPIDQVFVDMAEGLEPVERRLAHSLVYGVLRQRDQLDAAISQCSTHPVEKMKTRSLMTLRVGAYQLLFLSRIPASAAVNATVNTLKNAGQPNWLVGFVNGVLRAIAARREELLNLRVFNNCPILNHPPWLVKRWQAQFGPERTRRICEINNTEPPLILRVNTSRCSRSELQSLLHKSGIKANKGLFSPVALRIVEYPGPIPALPGYEQGFFQVQDEAAQLTSLLFSRLKQPVHLLDACAGLGGKTSHLAELLPPGSAITAIEPDATRFALLRKNLARLGHSEAVRCLRTRLYDYAAAQAPLAQAVLIDAPCSGTGVIRRQPDIRWNRQPEDIPIYHQQQHALLEQAAPLLSPGGSLVYATCSLEPEENWRVVQRFLDSRPRFTLMDAKKTLPETAHVLVDAHGCLHPLPMDGCDGFFACLLQAPGL